MDFGMVGFLRERDRAELVRLYIVSVRLDAEGIVDQLIRMGAADVHVNRRQLALDINRLLMKYANLPLKDIRAREVMEEITPIMFHHRLRLPSNLWLLGKTLAMMEGIGLQLDPDFDVFAVSEPFVQKLTLAMFLPRRAWLEQGVQMGMEWEQFIRTVPRAALQILEDFERREPLPLQVAGAERFMKQVHRLFIYLVFGILLAALIVALAFLLAMSPSGGWVQILLGGALFLVLGVSIGLLISMLWNQPR
jgi:ubiquinone biosynthesis protein